MFIPGINEFSSPNNEFTTFLDHGSEGVNLSPPRDFNRQCFWQGYRVPKPIQVVGPLKNVL